MTVRIPLRARDGSVRAEALVDASDHAWLDQWRWTLHPKGYAVSMRWENGRQRHYKMHRVLLGLDFGDGRQGDHINGDRLDNRRSNLRIVTNAENHQNIVRHRASGVFPSGNRWRVEIRANGARNNIGTFVDREEAIAAALAFRAEYMPYAARAA